MNVLLTSIGRRVSLLRAFRRELAKVSPEGRVLGADVSPLSAGLREADAGFVVPGCGSAGYVPALLDLVERQRIGLLVPLIDPELEVLTQHRAAFAARGCFALVSDPGPVQLTRDKAQSAHRFRELGFDAPRVFDAAALAAPERLPYPVFLKPADGSSSVGALAVADADELRYHLARTQRPVVESLERGDEFTVDVFADLEGRARCAVPRQRLEVRAGEVSKGRTVKDRSIMHAAAGLVEALGGCRGCITLQCFRTPDGRVVFFEANLRFGGGFPLSYAAGANFPRWAIQLARGQPVESFDGWTDGLVMLRYDEAVFFKEARRGAGREAGREGARAAARDEHELPPPWPAG